MQEPDNERDNIVENIETQESRTPIVQGEKPAVVKESRNRWPIYILVVLLLLATGLAVWWFFLGGDKMFSIPPKPVETVTKPAEKIDDPELARFLQPTTGETWLDTPKKLDDLGYMDPASSPDLTTKPAYTEVGKRGDNTIILALAPSVLSWQPFLFERTPAGDAKHIVYPLQSSVVMDAVEYKDFKTLFTSKVAMDETTRYDSLSVPAKLDIGNNVTVKRVERPHLGYKDLPVATKNIKETKVKTLGKNTLYRVEAPFVDTGLTNIYYELRSVLGLHVMLDYLPHTVSLEKYVWDNGKVATKIDMETKKQVSDTLNSIARGCGGIFVASVTRSDVLKEADLVQVGKTDAGVTVYQPKDASNTLIKKAYDEYATFMKDTDKKPVSLDVYLADHALVIIRNAANEPLVYTRDSYTPAYGCAKPVVYLYPTQTTTVNVRVGADVRISDPLYPTGGWTVRAQPNGKLTYAGAVYDSLFWEGPGYGPYPTVASGTVVKRADALATMTRQLAQQGLNTKESRDFLDFWQDRIPNKPYVRLTWFDTAQMDRLAPLAITPRPTTVQRIFLDMDGYDTPIRIPTQNLKGFERRGFTVVEWGGLAHM